MIDGKNVLAITLARGGSVSIPKKNIVPINNKPLLAYTVEEVKQSAYIDKYFVSTDDKEIAKVAMQLEVDVINRPPHLATSTATSASSLLHAVQECNFEAYYVVEIMATNPLKKAEDIDACIKKLWETGADSVVSVVRIYDHHPARVKWIDNDRMHDFFNEVPESRRQDLAPPAYVRNGSIYAMTRDFLLKKQIRYDQDTRPYIMSECRTVNIDEPRDLLIAEILLKDRTND